MGPCLFLDLTVDDLVAYSLHVHEKSQVTRKQLRRVQLVILPVFLVVMLLAFAEGVRRPTGDFVVLVAVGAGLLASMLLLPWYVSWSIPRRIRGMATSGLVSAPKPSQLWVDDHGGIVDQSMDRTTWYSPAAIDSIEETSDHVFVKVGPADVLIIPRRVGALAVQEFLGALAWHRAQRTAT